MNDIDIETMNFQQSAVLEQLILDLGKILHRSLVDANRYEEVAALSELIGEFTLLASSYGEKTTRIREDLGVSLNEAALLKLSAIKRRAATSDLEWKYYADDTKKVLDELEKSRQYKA